MALVAADEKGSGAFIVCFVDLGSLFDQQLGNLHMTLVAADAK